MFSVRTIVTDTIKLTKTIKKTGIPEKKTRGKMTEMMKTGIPDNRTVYGHVHMPYRKYMIFCALTSRTCPGGTCENRENRENRETGENWGNWGKLGHVKCGHV